MRAVTPFCLSASSPLASGEASAVQNKCHASLPVHSASYLDKAGVLVSNIGDANENLINDGMYVLCFQFVFGRLHQERARQDRL